MGEGERLSFKSLRYNSSLLASQGRGQGGIHTAGAVTL